MMAEATTQKCPMCAEDIPLDAKACEYCGAKFSVVVKGYCANDHSVVQAGESGQCSQCGGELTDRRVESRFVDEAVPRAQPTPPPQPAASELKTAAPMPRAEATPRMAHSKSGSFIDRNLSPGEEIVYRTRLHWIKLIHAPLNLLIGLAAFLFAGAGAYSLAQNPYGNTVLNRLVFVYFPLLIAVVGFASAIAEVVGYIGSDVAVTSRRVLARSGGVIRKSISIPLADIARIDAGRGVFFMFDYGLLRIATARRRVYLLPSVPRPQEVKMRIEAQLGPGPRLELKRVSIGKVLLAILGLAVLIIGVIVVIFLLDTGYYRQFLPPETTTVDAIRQRPLLHQRVVVDGRLEIAQSVRCYESGGARVCNLDLADAHGHSVPLWVPERMMSGGSVILSGNAFLGDGDSVRVTGQVEPCAERACVGVSADRVEPLAATSAMQPEPTATRRAPTPTRVQPAATRTLEPTESGCLPGAKFVQDVTIPDGTQFKSGESFTKVWRVRSSGCAEWTSGTRWVFVSGAQMGAPEGVDAPDTPLGETADVSVSMRAPSEPGTYKGYWQMQGPDGENLGDQAYVMIVVPGAPAACPPNPALVSVVNELGTRIALTITGPRTYRFAVSSGQTRNVCVEPGTYSYSASASGFKTQTGDKTLDAGGPQCWWWYAGIKVHVTCSAPTDAGAYSPP